jgi:hypothetical protein
MSHVGKKARETRKRNLGLSGLADDEEEPPPKKALFTPDSSTRITPAIKPWRPGAEWPREALELWEYIRPYLTVHKSGPIPTKYWIPNLLVLPRVRDLEFNPRRTGKRPYLDTDDKKVAALLVFLTGRSSSQPCWRCRSGSGAFNGCVKLPYNNTTRIKINNCANCWYAHQACGSDDPIRQDATVAKEEAKEDAQEVDSEKDDVSDGPQLLSEDSQQFEPRLPPILHSRSGRLYSEWPGEP